MYVIPEPIYTIIYNFQRHVGVQSKPRYKYILAVKTEIELKENPTLNLESVNSLGVYFWKGSQITKQ